MGGGGSVSQANQDAKSAKSSQSKKKPRSRLARSIGGSQQDKASAGVVHHTIEMMAEADPTTL